MGKQKGLKLTIIILTAVMIVSAFSIILITFGLSLGKKDSHVDINAAYTISNWDSLNSNYDSYSEFHIYDVNGLQAFAGGVYAYNSVNHSFAGKTVKLMADIPCGGAAVTVGVNSLYGRVTTSPVFAGTFDGNGKTISNFKLGTTHVTVGGYSISGNSVGQTARGLFLNVTGTIKNVRLASVNVSEGGVSGGYGGHTTCFQAAMVGFLNGGTVTNCVVDGFSGSYYASGIIGSGYNGNVNNCYVANVSRIGEMGYYGIGPCVDKVFTNNSSTQYNYFSCSISKCVTVGLTTSLLASTNCHTSPNSVSGLGASSSSGSSGWYYHSDYNGGYPYLRTFIGWKTVSFTKGSGVSSFNPSSIQIPGSLNQTFSSSSNTITIYGQQVLAVRSSSYCNHSTISWTCNSATSYTANFNKPSRTLTIQTKEGSKAATTLTTKNVSCCSALSVSTTGSSSKYTKCVVSGHTYTAPITHVITSLSHSNGAKISANTTVTINIARKQYDVVFG